MMGPENKRSITPAWNEASIESWKQWIAENTPPIDPLKFLGEFESSYPDAFHLMRIGQVYPIPSETPPINLYTGEAMSDRFDNIGRHCLAVAFCARTLAQELTTRGLLPKISVDEIEERALIEDAAKGLEIMRNRWHFGINNGVLTPSQVSKITARAINHDSPKGIEIMRRNAAREGKYPHSVYSEKAYAEVEALLIKHGVNAALAAKMKNAGRETGHQSLPSFLEVGRDGALKLVEGDWDRKIIHLADDMTGSSQPTPTEKERTFFLAPVEKIYFADFHKKYPWLWKEGFGFNLERSPIILTDVTATGSEDLRHVKTYIVYQVLVSNMICAELKSILDPYDLNSPEYFIKRLVYQKLQDLSK